MGGGDTYPEKKTYQMYFLEVTNHPGVLLLKTKDLDHVLKRVKSPKNTRNLVIIHGLVVNQPPMLCTNPTQTKQLFSMEQPSQWKNSVPFQQVHFAVILHFPTHLGQIRT